MKLPYFLQISQRNGKQYYKKNVEIAVSYLKKNIFVLYIFLILGSFS